MQLLASRADAIYSIEIHASPLHLVPAIQLHPPEGAPAQATEQTPVQQELLPKMEITDFRRSPGPAVVQDGKPRSSVGSA
jgi:hypothetical protein